MKNIIKAVYAQATSLAFLNDEELFVTADKNKSMKEIKGFIELLIEKGEKIV